jgi:hypothetical protein
VDKNYLDRLHAPTPPCVVFARVSSSKSVIAKTLADILGHTASPAGPLPIKDGMERGGHKDGHCNKRGKGHKPRRMRRRRIGLGRASAST